MAADNSLTKLQGWRELAFEQTCRVFPGMVHPDVLRRLLDRNQLTQLRHLVAKVVNLLEAPEKMAYVCCIGGNGNVGVYARVDRETWTLYYDGGGYILSQRSPVLPEALAVLSILGEIKHG